MLRFRERFHNPQSVVVKFTPSTKNRKLLRRMKLDFLTWFVSALCCYRLSVLISRDIGPFGICEKLRKHSKLAKCPYCTSVYMGSLVAIGLYFSGFVMPFITWCILSLSLSASSIVLDRCFTSDYLPK